MRPVGPLTWLVCVFALAACAAPSRSPTPPPAPTYLEVVAERVQAHRGEESYLVRHNPVGCACPTYEVRLGDIWHRVILEAEADEEVITHLSSRVVAAREAGRLETHVLQGSLQRGVEICGRGAAVVTLVQRGRLLRPPLVVGRT